MSIWTVMVKDGRGKRVPLVPNEYRLTFKLDPEKRRRLSLVSRLGWSQLSLRDVAKVVFYTLLTLPLFAASALMPAIMSFKLHLPLWSMFLVAVPLGLIPSASIAFIARRAGGERIARIYARASFCGSCGYDLKGLTPAEDGCTVCTECGSAWRIGDDALASPPRRV